MGAELKNKTAKLVIAPNRAGYIFLEGEFLGRIDTISASSLSRVLRRRLPERDAEKYAKILWKLWKGHGFKTQISLPVKN